VNVGQKLGGGGTNGNLSHPFFFATPDFFAVSGWNMPPGGVGHLLSHLARQGTTYLYLAIMVGGRIVAQKKAAIRGRWAVP
jgi:hypothetical protein